MWSAGWRPICRDVKDDDSFIDDVFYCFLLCTMIDSADNVTHMLPVTGPMRLQFATDATDAAPLFVAELTQDLLGDWVVTQLWSGKPQARGGGRVTVVSDQDAGFKMLQNIAQKKEKSGYRLI